MTENSTVEPSPLTAKDIGREILILAAVFSVLTALFSFVIYPMFGRTGAAPMPLRTVILVVVIYWLARARGESFSSFGFSRPKRIWLALVLGLAFVAINLFALSPAKEMIRDALSFPPADISALTHIYGNLPAYIGWLVITWVAAAFGEELIFRGYLMNRFAALGGGSATAWAIAILGQAVLFGAGHLYAGVGSAITTSFGAIFTGIFFFVAGRNLWALIIAHGIWDSLGITLIYLNGTPST